MPFVSCCAVPTLPHLPTHQPTSSPPPLPTSPHLSAPIPTHIPTSLTIQVLSLVGLLNLLPVLFKLYGTFYEQRKSQSDVDLSVIRRFFDFLMANIYVTLMAATAFKSARVALMMSFTNFWEIAAQVCCHANRNVNPNAR